MYGIRIFGVDLADDHQFSVPDENIPKQHKQKQIKQHDTFIGKIKEAMHGT